MNPTALAQISALRAAGVVDLGEILRNLTRPTVTTTATTAARIAPAAERALRDLVVSSGLMTLAQWKTFAAAGSLEETVKTRLEARLTTAATDAEKLAALVLERRVEIQRDRVSRKGGEPFSAAAGDDTRPDTVTTLGPSWWDTNAPGEPEPTLHAIRQILKETNL